MPMPTANILPKSYRKAIDILESTYDKNYKIKSKEEYRKIICEDLGLKFYFYSEKELVGYAGKTYPLIRLIVLDSEIDGIKYCETFAHEAFHLKHFTGQEDYVCFQTFKYLYESNELHNCGVLYGLWQIYGFYSGEYNIPDLIVDYLTNKWKFDILKVSYPRYFVF